MDHKEIKSYTRSSYGLLFVGVFFLGLGLLGFAVDVASPIGMLLLMFALGAACSAPYFIGQRRLNKAIEEYEAQYGADALVKDFNASRPVINDHLRLGEEWLFGKRTATIVRYEQIKKIYMYVHRTNGVEDRRALKIETAAGKTLELCNLPTKGVFKKQNHPDVETILKVILIKNPSVHVGYK